MNWCSFLMAHLGLLIIHSNPDQKQWLFREWGDGPSKVLCLGQSPSLKVNTEILEKGSTPPLPITTSEMSGVRRCLRHLETTLSSHMEEAISAGKQKEANRQREGRQKWRETRQRLENDTTGQEEQRSMKAETDRQTDTEKERECSGSLKIPLLALMTSFLQFSFHSVLPIYGETINSHFFLGWFSLGVCICN